MFQFLLLFYFPFLLSCKLLMVLEVFRHGARQPVYDYWNAKSFKGFGELTPVGMHQHYILGQYLRQTYITEQSFLSNNYNPNELYVRSTNLNRTITSAMSQLYGLYPLEGGPILPEGIEERLILPPFKESLPLFKERNQSLSKRIWGRTFGLKEGFQPIPILSFEEKDDTLLRPFMPRICPVNIILDKKQKIGEKYLKWQEDFQTTFRTLESMLLVDKLTITAEKTAQIIDVFIADIYNNFSLPENMTESLWKNITFLYTMNLYYVKLGTPEQKRFQNTPFFQEILDNFDNKLKNPSTSYKFKMFSAHDLTLGFLLAGFNLTSYECHEEIFLYNETKAYHCFGFPSFASNMLIELHRDEINERNEVMIRYNGEYVNLCEREKKSCDYEEFAMRMRNFMIEDFDIVCKNKSKQERINSRFKIIFE